MDGGGAVLASGDGLHGEEIIRIHELWQHTKNELKAKARELAELERTRAMEIEQVQSEHTNGMREMQVIAIELRDKTRVLETQLQGAREENRRLAEQAADAQRKTREAQLQAETQTSSARHYEQRMGELQESLRTLQRERKEVIDKSYADFRRQEDGLAQRELAIGQLEGRLRTAQHDARTAREERQLEADRAREQLRRFEDADHANRELSKQLGAAREQLKFLQISRRNESQLHAIVDQLQLDNARLVKILAATDEFKEFVDYADDSAGLSYIAPSASAGISAALRADAAQRTARPVRGAAAEKEGWVPSDAYTLANEFRHEHTPGVPPEVFADLLLRLNAVWRQREQRRVARLKERFREERARLSRRHAHALPFEVVAQEAEVERLKRELRAVRLGVGSGRRRLNETEEKLFEASLAAVESLSAQARRAARAARSAERGRPRCAPHAPHAALGAEARDAACRAAPPRSSRRTRTRRRWCERARSSMAARPRARGTWTGRRRRRARPPRWWTSSPTRWACSCASFSRRRSRCRATTPTFSYDWSACRAGSSKTSSAGSMPQSAARVAVRRAALRLAARVCTRDVLNCGLGSRARLPLPAPRRDRIRNLAFELQAEVSGTDGDYYDERSGADDDDF